jgi:hypothetical protein
MAGMAGMEEGTLMNWHIRFGLQRKTGKAINF